MKKKILIIFALFYSLFVLGNVTPEREQQFTYYYYAAIRSLQAEQYDQAMMQLLFCEELKPDDGQVAEYLGMLYDALGEKEKALYYLEKAYHAAPEDLWERYVQQLLHSKDTELFIKGKKTLEEVCRLNPQNSEVWEELQNVYIYSGEYKKAIAAQDQVDKLIGYNAYSALNRYRAYVLWNKPKKALQAVEQYLKEDPTDVKFLLFRVEVLERMNAKWKVLKQAYENALQIDKQNPTLLNNYAYGLAIHGGDLNQAERMSQMALQQQPDSPIFLDTYAWILHLKGQNTLAVFYIKKALNVAEDKDKEVIQKHYEQIIK